MSSIREVLLTWSVKLKVLLNMVIKDVYFTGLLFKINYLA